MTYAMIVFWVMTAVKAIRPRKDCENVKHDIEFYCFLSLVD